MPTLHDLMSASIDARAAVLGAADASPADATRGLIARRRRRNAAVAGGTSALAIGGLVAAGLVQGSRENAPASVGPDTIEYVKVDMNTANVNHGFSGWATTVNCGDEVPSPVAEVQGFTQSVAVDPTTSGDSLRISASLSYEGTDRTPAFITPGYAVLARDGVVLVQYPVGNGNEESFGGVAGGQTWNSGDVLGGGLFDPIWACRTGIYTPPSADDVAYAAGDYQVYVVSEAVTSAPLVAVQELSDRGYYVAEGSRGVWNPGSVDCQQAVTSAGSGATPVQCLDSLPPGVSIDAKSHTATLPYHSANYSGELNVTLVSQPITVTLDHNITYGDLGVVSAPTAQPTSDQPLTCGQVDGRLTLGSDFTTTFAQPVTLADLLSGAEEPILFDARTRDERSRGTLRLADGAIASVVLGDSGSGGWVAAQGSAALAPSVVSIDRAKGYPDVSLKLDGMTECPAPTEGPWTVRQLDSPTIGVLLVIQGDLRVDWEDGTTTTAESMTLNGRAEG